MGLREVNETVGIDGDSRIRSDRSFTVIARLAIARNCPDDAVGRHAKHAGVNKISVIRDIDTSCGIHGNCSGQAELSQNRRSAFPRGSAGSIAGNRHDRSVGSNASNEIVPGNIDVAL